MNKILEFKCNTCIILGYLHSLWNLEGYYIALPKPKNNIIPTPYSDNILNHGINEGIVKLVTLMVKVMKLSLKWRYCKYTLKFYWSDFIPSMWPILHYLHVHIPIILHWSIEKFVSFMSKNAKKLINPHIDQLSISLFHIL